MALIRHTHRDTLDQLGDIAPVMILLFVITWLHHEVSCVWSVWNVKVSLCLSLHSCLFFHLYSFFSLSLPYLCLLSLIYSALGAFEHLYYKAILNNRSFAPSDRRTRLQGNGDIHKCMHTKSQRQWGTSLEGSNLLVLSRSSAISLVAFIGLHLKVTDNNTPNRRNKIYITQKSVMAFVYL